MVIKEIPFERLGEPADERPYLPYLVAKETGIISNPDELAKPINDSAGTTILAGEIPNYRQAGIIAIGSQIGAFDHVALEPQGNRWAVYPASKDNVIDGNIERPGAIVFTDSEGSMRLAAGSVPYDSEHLWMIGNLRHRGQRVTVHESNVGAIAVFLFSYETPELEVSDIDYKTGIMTAKPRYRIF